jgi:inosine/xanthosine triphosphate pyrophosphatase family protein
VAPRGGDKNGWYNIFQPKGLEKTLEELPEEERNKHTHRYFACEKLTAYFKEQHPHS